MGALIVRRGHCGANPVSEVAQSKSMPLPMYGNCLSSSVDTLCTCWDNLSHYKTKSVDFLGLMNSATKL